MMPVTKFKCIAAVAVAGLFAAGNAAYAAATIAQTVSDAVTTAEGTYTVACGDARLTVDTTSLNLEITKGGRTWYSGRRDSEDDGLNSLWVSKLTDAVTVGYRDITRNTTTERAMSLLKNSVSFTQREDGFDAVIACTQISVTFTLQVRLDGDSLTVTVPGDSITETSDTYKLEYLLVYPFFDSSYSLADGQIFIPDGCGAVIDLSRKTSATQSYSARVYGADYGISATSLSSVSPEAVTAPVFALLYGDGGTMVTADSGAEYCSVNASVSSITTDYNFAYFQWIYRESYVKYYESTGTDGKSYIAFQDEKNDFDLVQTFTLLDAGSSVSDVACAYRERLTFKESAAAATEAGLRLEFLMAENKQGMFGSEVIAMTTTSYAAKTAKEVAAYCPNLSVSLIGYTAGGLNGSYPNHFPVEGKTGGSSGYSSLASALKKEGIALSFVTDFVKAYDGASVANKNLALNISNQFITLADTRAGSSAKFHLLNIGEAVSRLKSDVSVIKGYSAGVDYASAGSLLYSGYKNSNFSRSDVIAKMTAAVGATGLTTNMFQPNSYMWSVCDGYLDIPVTASGFLIETASVPFLQMVLSGHMQMYCAAVNLNYTGREQILKLIDYNVYPSFTLTEQDAIELYGTNSAGIFTSSYAVWGETVESIYGEVSAVLSQVAGCTVINRYQAASGVYVTQYSNGVSVAVNYTSAAVTVGETELAAQSAAAIVLG